MNYFVLLSVSDAVKSYLQSSHTRSFAMRTCRVNILIACICGAVIAGCDNYGNDIDEQTDSRNRDTTVIPEKSSPADSPRIDPNKPADNTGINQRDRDDSTMLPTDQGGASSDTEMTQAIRKRITAMDSLSMNARNIKIITLNGEVTLRGPVSSQAERDQIVAIAHELAGPDHVVNELEVINP